MSSATCHSFDSPLGPLTLHEQDGAITVLEWGKARTTGVTELLSNAERQLREYFNGSRQTFTVPLKPHGTTFQRAVWDAMRAIPYGGTRTYGDVALTLDSAPRAVGTACGKNPIRSSSHATGSSAAAAD